MKEKQVAAEASVVDQTNLLPKKELLVVFSVLAISLFICFVDQNGIGVILPTISRDLDAADTISWAGTSALIANTVFQVLFGRLSDLFGRKVVFLSALVLLAVCDLLCGFSQNATMLYIFRGLAGVANGGIASLSMMIVSDIVTLKERGKYQGILGAYVGMGNMVGPFIAAAFAQHSTWRGLFWLVSPLAALCCVICFFILPASNDSSKLDFRTVSKKIDYWGILAGSAAIILILVPVSGGGSYFRWDSPMVIAMLAIGGICALAFLFIEHKVALLPMMPLSLFKNAPVCILLVQNFLFGIVYYSQLYYLPLFFQNARRMSPITSAALVLPITAAQMTLSIVSGQYISRRERYGEVIWLGFFLWTLGVGLTCIFDQNTPIAAIVVILLVQGAGVGLIFQPTLVALQAHCSKAQRAIVISNRNFLRSLGGAVGLAISAAALQNSLKKAMPQEFASALSSYDTPDFAALGASPEQIQEVLDAYAKASRTVFIMNVPFMGLCLLGCLLIKDRGLQRPDELRVAQSSDTINGVEVEKGNGDEIANVQRPPKSDLNEEAKGALVQEHR
ncbi:MFS general substrate transporter [Aureobasidium pullulans]|uniref:MFS general substrate transporter n=1 Tax=Aureobasidium pullulans TaxID=5580 RepID=A0A4S9LDE5_AURPU|nr:MFS general substrate transporter [Aureobasidium pullulans]THW73357.1 MFS general substrate transporter [Aureobasidium pullulans]THY26765.1 MFS general substrate transporter [Aureobasidium pullulans]